MIRELSAWWEHNWHGKPAGKRSSEWGGVRDAFLEQHPKCACCEGTKNLRVHHIQPFHLFPELELTESNLITLCEDKRYGINCHLLLGHLGNWSRWNPLVRINAKMWNLKLKHGEDIERMRQVAKELIW